MLGAQDFVQGSGELPQEGQEVIFDYNAYNESGSRIDSSYNKGRPAQTRLGINGLIPGAPYNGRLWKLASLMLAQFASADNSGNCSGQIYNVSSNILQWSLLNMFPQISPQHVPTCAKCNQAPSHVGFELGVKGMRPGGKRRLVVPPELGPPVGPSTFFSAKQCEVFDVELRAIRTCRRRQVAMFSDVVCE